MQTDARLQRRGIAQAANDMQWTPVRNGWEYPVFDTSGQTIARRFKSADSSASPKYLWVDDARADYYHAPDLLQAIREANGHLIIANGEPGVLTFRAARMRNVLCVFGEGRIPSDTGETLKSWGVRHVDYWPDLDAPMKMRDGTIKPPAGLLAARKWHDTLERVGITFNAYDLSVHGLPVKGDTNDLWQVIHFDRDGFSAALAACPLATLPPSPEPKPRTQRTRSASTGRLSRQQAIEQVQAALGIDGFKSNGYSRNICCPFHDDQKASAGLHQSGTLHCFVCGDHDLADLAKRFNIDWQPYTPQQPVVSATAQAVDLSRAPDDMPETAAETAWYSQGVPDSFRRALIEYFAPTVAPLIEIIIDGARSGHLNPDGFTVREVVDASLGLGRAMSPKTIGDILPTLTGGQEFFGKITVGVESPTAEIPKNSQRGRKSESFRVNPLTVWRNAIRTQATPRIYAAAHRDRLTGEDILARPTVAMLEAVQDDQPEQTVVALDTAYSAHNAYDLTKRHKAEIKADERANHLRRDLADLHSTPLPEGFALGDRNGYKAAFARAMIRTNERHTKETIYRLTGIKRSAIRHVMDCAGFEAVPQVDTVHITHIAQAKKQAKGKGCIRKLIAHYPNGNKAEMPYVNDEVTPADGFIETQIARGAVVSVEIQAANLYVLRDDLNSQPESTRSVPKARPAATAESTPHEPPNTPTTAPHTGKGYDPEWVYRQLMLGLKAVHGGRYLYRGDDVIDDTTGEIYSRPTAQVLIALILEREIPAVQSDPGIETCYRLIAGVPGLQGATVRKWAR